ncbi:MetQ/NlpA family ABC transporter substrate-binding protein [Neisseriaceae bacterium JH1-16]|nr:MetQ/NlpA family ABC transporter substrate-binding protein [Neisseriaceae bacterium JH1-16]
MPFFRILALAGLAGALLAAQAQAAKPIRIGVTDGPQAETLAEVKPIAAARGVPIELVRYPNGKEINRDLAAGRLDAASFQNGVAFAHEVKRHRYPLVDAALTVTLPMGIYSRKIASLRQLKDGDALAVPNDHAGVARALILLQNYGLLTLADSTSLNGKSHNIESNLRSGLHGIESNPHRYRLVPLPAAQLAASRGRYAAALIDYVDAARAGLSPARDGVGMEDARTPYAGVLAVRRADLQQSWLKALISSYRSEPVARFILTRYQDSVRRPW